MSDTCSKCGMPMENEGDSCVCNSSVCTHCCVCDDTCGCDCNEAK